MTTKTEQKTTVTDLSQQISFPDTTVLRYIKILEDNGYTIHLRAPDQPNGWLQLTLQGQATIRTTLLALNAI